MPSAARTWSMPSAERVRSAECGEYEEPSPNIGINKYSSKQTSVYFGGSLYFIGEVLKLNHSMLQMFCNLNLYVLYSQNILHA